MATASRATAVFDLLCHQFGPEYAPRRGESCILTKRQDVQTRACSPTPPPSKKSQTSRAKLRFRLRCRSRRALNMNLVEARTPFHKTSTKAKTNYLNGAWGVLHVLGPRGVDFSTCWCYAGWSFLPKCTKNARKVDEIANPLPCSSGSHVDVQKSLNTS